MAFISTVARSDTAPPKLDRFFFKKNQYLVGVLKMTYSTVLQSIELQYCTVRYMSKVLILACSVTKNYETVPAIRGGRGVEDALRLVRRRLLRRRLGAVVLYQPLAPR